MRRITALLSLVGFYVVSICSTGKTSGADQQWYGIAARCRIKIWGWAAKDEKVTLAFNGKSYEAVTDADGKWLITLPKMKAGGPYKMDIRASNEIHLSNILFGDVWLCSGQSNMVLNMERVKEKYPDEIAAANYPEIRNFFIPTIADATKTRADLPPGKWVPADQTNVLSFGAATYFFAKQVYEKHHIPIGIINSSVGGTPIEAWISEEGLKEFPDHLKSAARFKDTAFINDRPGEMPASNTGRAPRIETDKGLTGANKWFDPAYTQRLAQLYHPRLLGRPGNTGIERRGMVPQRN
jgi:sialate O-acetylesterase